MKIKDVMTRDVVTVEPATPLKQVAALLVERRVSGLPVVDPDGKQISSARSCARTRRSPVRSARTSS